MFIYTQLIYILIIYIYFHSLFVLYLIYVYIRFIERWMLSEIDSRLLICPETNFLSDEDDNSSPTSSIESTRQMLNAMAQNLAQRAIATDY